MKRMVTYRVTVTAGCAGGFPVVWPAWEQLRAVLLGPQTGARAPSRSPPPLCLTLPPAHHFPGARLIHPLPPFVPSVG